MFCSSTIYYNLFFNNFQKSPISIFEIISMFFVISENFDKTPETCFKKRPKGCTNSKKNSFCKALLLSKCLTFFGKEIFYNTSMFF